jgi:hypothetical protein
VPRDRLDRTVRATFLPGIEPMNTAHENALYYLVVDQRAADAVFVFLGTRPISDYAAQTVSLELLPPDQRFVGCGGVSTGRPVLGRWPGGLNRFRQFPTVSEMEQAGWVPVSQYRVCDCWDDYAAPWACSAALQPTLPGSTAHDVSAEPAVGDETEPS